MDASSTSRAGFCTACSPEAIGKTGCCVMYAELAVTTNFSFLRGASHPEELVACAKRLGLRRHRHRGPQQRRRRGAGPYGGAARRDCGSRSGRGSSLPTARPISWPIRATVPPGDGSPACSRSASCAPPRASASWAWPISRISSPGSISSSWRRRASMPRPCRDCWGGSSSGPRQMHLACRQHAVSRR